MINNILKTDVLNGLFLEWVNDESMIESNDYTSSYIYPENNIYPYAIKEKDNTIGYIFLEQTEDNVLYVQFIEILDEFKNEGYGRTVVLNLFEWFNVLYIDGIVLDDGYLGAYYFWDSLGANFECDYLDNGEPNFNNDVYFILKKEGVE